MGKEQIYLDRSDRHSHFGQSEEIVVRFAGLLCIDFCRKEVLTNHAKKWLEMYHLKVFTTYSLFKLIRDVEARRLSKKKAIKIIIKGEKV